MSVVLLIPTVIAFLVDRVIQGRQAAMIASKSVPLVPKPNQASDLLALIFCSGLVFLILSFYATALFASLVKVWPYDLSMGFWHYHFPEQAGADIRRFSTVSE